MTERTEMLENVGNNIILPSFQALQDSLDRLESAADAFTDAPSGATLSELRDELKSVRLAWQEVNLFQFGPSESVLLRSSLNTFPTDTAQIESNIDSGDYTLGTVANVDAAGFPALGYLLHGAGESDAEIVAAYTAAPDADRRMTYLSDNIDFIRGKVDAAAGIWAESGDNYLDTFLSDDRAGTDAGSSLGMMVNAMILHYERFIRDGKIGIPSGIRSAGVPRPSAAEANYGGYSAELALANVRAIKRLFLGTGHDGAQGTGLDNNLRVLGAGDLADEIEAEIDQGIAALEGLSDPLTAQIEQNNDPVLSAFAELQDVTVLLKADMASILGVTITYQDNDGD